MTKLATFSRAAEWQKPRGERAYPSRPWLFERDHSTPGYHVQTSFTTLHVGDVHISDTPPGWRTDSYREDILAKLAQVAALAEEHEVDLIMFAGDVFHRRRGVSSDLIAAVDDVMRAADCLKLILPGNHDLRDNLLASSVRQPIGLLARMPGWALAQGPEPLVYPGLVIRPIPYRSEPMPYDYRLDEDLKTKYPDRWILNWYHYGVSRATNPHYHTLDTQSEEWDSGAHYVFSGHVHDDLGVHKARDGAVCFNLGALSRGALTEDNLTRIPRVLLTNWYHRPKAPEFKAIELEVKPSSEVFLLSEQEQERDRSKVAEAFVEAIGETRVGVLSIPDLIDRVRQRDDLSGSVRDKVVTALEDVA